MRTISETAAGKVLVSKDNRLSHLWNNIKTNRFLLLMLIPGITYFIVFHYLPMYGTLMAFKNFSPRLGLLGSPWTGSYGFKWFVQFFSSVFFWRLIKNTILLSLYSLIWGFPIPIIFALFLNEIKDGLYKRVVQTISYLPHFISVTIVVGIAMSFLSPTDGIINTLIENLGHEPVNFLNESGWFRTIYIGTGIWQQFGWNCIIYLAALSAVDIQLYEAAKMDGASKFQQLIHISIPSILPTIIILLILNVGQMMDIGFEKIILLYNPATYNVADVISTYVYRRGIVGGEFSFATAVGLFNSVINFALLVSVNKFSKKVSDTYLW